MKATATFLTAAIAAGALATPAPVKVQARQALVDPVDVRFNGAADAGYNLVVPADGSPDFDP